MNSGMIPTKGKWVTLSVIRLPPGFGRQKSSPSRYAKYTEVQPTCLALLLIKAVWRAGVACNLSIWSSNFMAVSSIFEAIFKAQELEGWCGSGAALP